MKLATSLRRLRRTVVVTALVVTLGMTAACGGSGEETGGSRSGEEVTTLKVADLGLTASAPLYLAMEKGYFEDEGLTVEAVPATGGAVGVPGVVSNDVQVATGNLISLMQAKEQGIALVAVAADNEGAEDIKDVDHTTDAILVRPDSGIKTAEDLEGKTIAVNALSSLGDATIKAALEKRGVDVATLEFTELGFPDMVGALEAKRVDAIWEVEPFYTAAKDAGFRPISYPFEEAARGLPLGVSFVTQEFAEANPTTVKRFKSALDRAGKELSTDDALLRKTVPTFSEITPEVANKMALPLLTPEFSEENVQGLADISLEYGLLDEEPDLEEIFGRVMK